MSELPNELEDIKNNDLNTQTKRKLLNKFTLDIYEKAFPSEEENYLRPSVDKYLEHYAHAVARIRKSIVDKDDIDIHSEILKTIESEPEKEFFTTKKTKNSFGKNAVDLYVQELPELFKNTVLEITL